MPEARVTESARRLLRLKARFVRDAETVPADAVGSDAHQAVMREAARRALTMVRGAIPAVDPRRAALVEFTFAVGSQAEDVRADTELGEALAARFRDLRRVALPSAAPPADLVADARRLAEAADPLIIATRSASLSDAQRTFAQDLLEIARARSHDTLLVCLRNPWDAAVFPEAANVLASLGDAWPSLEAVADALAGATVPAGRLPRCCSVYDYTNRKHGVKGGAHLRDRRMTFQKPESVSPQEDRDEPFIPYRAADCARACPDGTGNGVRSRRESRHHRHRHRAEHA
ncbi:MAG: FUSC family protein [Anaerolineae bacterium]|nr:FUSC family protein [Anaerolineae bacterium]